MLNEPVRGSLPKPSFFSLSGLEQLRAYMQGLMPPTPLARLLGVRVTQASSGTCVLTQPISPWFEVYDGFVDLAATAEYCAYVTAITGAPPGAYVRTVNLSVRYLRACTVEDEMVIARGRILHAGSTFTTVEILVEDALGRAVAHSTASVVINAMDPLPPPLSAPLEAVEEPFYSTPDPPRRPVEGAIRNARDDSDTSGPIQLAPFGRFLGMQLLEITDDRVKATVPATEWFCRLHREVAPGILAIFTGVTAASSRMTITAPNETLLVLNQTSNFMTPVPADGRELTAVASINSRIGESLVLDVKVTDQDGRTVVTSQGAGLLVDLKARPGRRPADRVLLSVLFTDLVGSTELAGQLGDAPWRELLDEHNALVRRQLPLYKGREVNTTGDGFMITFDSPTRAVQCARAIRERVAALGIEIRAGIHTGECELSSGDVTGVAVHVASRVQSAAQPGEILVTNTVRDLVSGSEVGLVDRGMHDLKGLDGKWTLLAVE